MWNFSFDRSSEETFKDFAHSEEGEVDIGTLHGFKLVHLVVLFMVDLVEEGLPVVIEVKEELFMLNHLGLSV